MIFRARQRSGQLGSAVTLVELIYHCTVRAVRSGQRNAVLGLLWNIFQTATLLITFWILFEFFGLSRLALRGDPVLYLMTGVFIYMTHTKTASAVFGAEGPTSGIMLHGPMNTAISIASTALATLYLQILSMATILYIYHAAFVPITIEEPVRAFAMVLLAWFFGVGVGMVCLAAKPWWPEGAAFLQMVWNRANLIASGKMIVGNSIGFSLLVLFIWNPLFHIIDQCRGYTFINYNPHHTSVMYPVYVSLGLLVIGMMGEFFTRRHASLSWGVGR